MDSHGMALTSTTDQSRRHRTATASIPQPHANGSSSEMIFINASHSRRFDVFAVTTAADARQMLLAKKCVRKAINSAAAGGWPGWEPPLRAGRACTQTPRRPSAGHYGSSRIPH